MSFDMMAFTPNAYLPKHYIGRGSHVDPNNKTAWPINVERFSQWHSVIRYRHTVAYLAKRRSDGKWCCAVIGSAGWLDDKRKTRGIDAHHALLMCEGHAIAGFALLKGLRGS